MNVEPKILNVTESIGTSGWTAFQLGCCRSGVTFSKKVADYLHREKTIPSRFECLSVLE